MMSFPSTLNYGGASIANYGTMKTTYTSTAVDKARSKGTSIYGVSDVLYGTKQNKKELISFKGTDFSNKLHQKIGSESVTDGGSISETLLDASWAGKTHGYYENPFRFPSEVLASVNRYNFIYKKATTVINEGEKQTSDSGLSSVIGQVAEVATTMSLFNPEKNIQVVGMTENVPLLNNYKDNEILVDGIPQLQAVNGSLNQATVDRLNMSNTMKIKARVGVSNINTNITDCSVQALVGSSKSKYSVLGRARYTFSDFMYCKDLGKVSNNHLITLRKFHSPIGDNIFKCARDDFEGQRGDFRSFHESGRLVCWFGTADNKLEDICKYDMEATWKNFESKIQEYDTEADSQDRGFLGTILNTFNPSYNAAVAAGTAGAQNLWSLIGSKFSLPLIGSMGKSGQYEHHKALTNYDNNKIYTPQNTIQETYQYEGKLKFNQEFSLTFSYKLRAYDNINPKSAFIDLLGNILEVTYRRGKFWGGARKPIGPPQNSSGYQKAYNMIDNAFDKLTSFMGGLLNGQIDWGEMLKSISETAKNMIASAADTAQQAIANMGKTKETIKGSIANTVEAIKKVNNKYGLLEGLKGTLKNSLGRPAIYALDSLLSGDNVGLWHVTVGNPKNPIMAFGNLIMTKATVTHSGPLGIDDFPTELKVIVQLKHGRPRDLSEVARMYTKGMGDIYQSGATRKLKDYWFVDDNYDEDLWKPHGYSAETEELIAKNAAERDAKAAEGATNAPETAVVSTTSAPSGKISGLSSKVFRVKDKTKQVKSGKKTKTVTTYKYYKEVGHEGNGAEYVDREYTETTTKTVKTKSSKSSKTSKTDNSKNKNNDKKTTDAKSTEKTKTVESKKTKTKKVWAVSITKAQYDEFLQDEKTFDSDSRKTAQDDSSSEKVYTEQQVRLCAAEGNAAVLSNLLGKKVVVENIGGTDDNPIYKYVVYNDEGTHIVSSYDDTTIVEAINGAQDEYIKKCDTALAEMNDAENASQQDDRIYVHDTPWGEYKDTNHMSWFEAVHGHNELQRGRLVWDQTGV